MAGMAVLIIQVAILGNNHLIALKRMLPVFQMIHRTSCQRFESKKESALQRPESINPRQVDRRFHPNDSIEVITDDIFSKKWCSKGKSAC